MREQLLEFTECMREHGIDMPDPVFSDGGRVEIEAARRRPAGRRARREDPTARSSQAAAGGLRPATTGVMRHERDGEGDDEDGWMAAGASRRAPPARRRAGLVVAGADDEPTVDGDGLADDLSTDSPTQLVEVVRARPRPHRGARRHDRPRRLAGHWSWPPPAR